MPRDIAQRVPAGGGVLGVHREAAPVDGGHAAAPRGERSRTAPATPPGTAGAGGRAAPPPRPRRPAPAAPAAAGSGWRTAFFLALFGAAALAGTLGWFGYSMLERVHLLESTMQASSHH